MPSDCSDCRAYPRPIPDQFVSAGVGEPILLWRGRVDSREPSGQGREPIAGALVLEWRRNFRLELHLDSPAPHGWWSDQLASPEPSKVACEFDGAWSELDVHHYRDQRFAWCNGGVLGDPEAATTEVIAAVTNLPMLRGGLGLHDHDQGHTWFPGRWRLHSAGWRIEVDRVFRSGDLFSAAAERDAYACTHLMRLTKADGTSFSHADADDVLMALQFGFSFAVGYWVGLVGPTGRDAAGRRLWLIAGAPHTGRAQRGSGWWADSRPEDLVGFLDLLLRQWGSPGPTDPLRSALTASILSHAGGFVEQRVATALSALETLSWTREVLEGGMPERSWRSKKSSWRLRRLLRQAQIATALADTPGSAVLSDFGRREGCHDLPDAVVEVRDRIVHPKPGRDVYEPRGVLYEAWQHASFWLELAVLHRLEYQGNVANRTIAGGWVGDTSPAPWMRADS